MAHLLDGGDGNGDGDGNAKHRMNIDGAEIAVEKTEEEDEEEEKKKKKKKTEEEEQGVVGSDQDEVKNMLLEGKILHIAQEISPILIINSPPPPPPDDPPPVQGSSSMCISASESDACKNTNNGSSSQNHALTVDQHHAIKKEADRIATTATSACAHSAQVSSGVTIANALPSFSSSSSPDRILKASSHGVDHKKDKTNQHYDNNINNKSSAAITTSQMTVITTSPMTTKVAPPSEAEPVPSSSSISSSIGTNNYLLKCGRAMTDEQLETLRRQISVYSTICNQLVEMHKALMAQHAFLPNMMVANGHHPQPSSYDSSGANGGGRTVSGRQRWTPSQLQLQILENLFERSNGTPSKQKIKAIAAQLGQHGSISESNVYNWFQNRKARAKRKQQHKEGESEVEPEEMDVVRKDKRAASDSMMFHQDQSNEYGRSIGSYTSSSLIRNDSLTGSIIRNDLLTHASGSSHMVTENGAEDSNMKSRDDPALYGEGLLLQRNERDFSSIVVFIDGKPWEVPSTTLDLRGSFGDGLALLDSHRQVVPTDENGFTTCPLHAGETYTLIKFNNIS